MSAKRTIRVVGAVAGVGLVAAAVGTELLKPRRKRTWHGRVAGVVPYDFRRPTAAASRRGGGIRTTRGS